MRVSMKGIGVIAAVVSAVFTAMLLHPVVSAEEMTVIDPDDLFGEYSDNTDAFVLFPGTADMQQGYSPHGALVTILVNETAMNSIGAGDDVFDDGSYIIKENYTEDRELALYTNMIKVEGFNPEGGDWYWVQYDADGTVSTAGDGTPMAGAVDSCIVCHAAVSDTDWVFTPF